MPTIQVLTPPAQEPVSLALLNQALRLDLDSGLLAAYGAGVMPEGTDPGQWAQLEFLALLASAARELVEGYTGGYYAAQELAITYRLDEEYELPAGGTAVAVSGAFSTLDELTNRFDYLEEYRKGISISRELDYLDGLNRTYTVVVAVAGDQAPALVRSAIAELTDEWYQNRGTTLTGTSLTELPVNYKVKLAHLRRNVLSTY